MRRKLILVFMMVLFSMLSGCTTFNVSTKTPTNIETKSSIDIKVETSTNTENISSENVKDNRIVNDSERNSNQNNLKEMQNNMINIKIGDNLFTATLIDNSSTKALKEMLSKGPITINMRDYENIEKVGSIGANLPRNDEYITTEAGDLILYQGNSLVIYYDTNSWNFTRLGKINNVTKDELKKALGSGSITATLSLV